MASNIFDLFTSPPAEQILTIILILVLTFSVVRVYRSIITRIAGTVPSGLIVSLQQIGTWSIRIFGAFYILNTLNVNILLLVALLSLGGLAMIVAYRNILAGTFLLTWPRPSSCPHSSRLR